MIKTWRQKGTDCGSMGRECRATIQAQRDEPNPFSLHSSFKAATATKPNHRCDGHQIQ